MAVFNFPFPYQAAGLEVTVRNADGDTVDTGTLASRTGSSRSDIVHQSSAPLLADEKYTASVESPLLGGAFEVQGRLDVPESLAANAGVGASETARGTLYLKASVTGASLNTASIATGDGAVMAYELDPDKTSTGDWWEQTEDGFVLSQFAAYNYGIASRGTATYPSTPDLVNIDVYDNDLGGANLGSSSAGTDDSPPFDVDLVTPLPFFCKEGEITGITGFQTFPITLRGFVVDNNGDQASGATLDFEARLSITQVWAGERYTEADFA